MNIESDAIKRHRGRAFQQLKKHLRDLHSDLGQETSHKLLTALRDIDVSSDLWPNEDSILKCDILPGGFHLEEPPALSFNASDFLEAGREMEAEALARKLHGRDLFPAGDHPCHTRFRFMVDELLSKRYVPYDWFWEEMYPDHEQATPPWKGAQDAELYVGFLERLIGLYPTGAIHNHSPVSHYTNVPSSWPSHFSYSPPYHQPPKHDYAVKLLDLGKALEQEMQENGCDHEKPDYMPHPAYTAFFEIWERVYLAGLEPLSLIASELGQALTLEFAALTAPWRCCDQFRKFVPHLGALSPLPSPAVSPSMGMNVDSIPPSGAPESSPFPFNPLDDLDVAEATPPHHDE